MSQFWSPIVQTLTPYVPGEQPKLPGLIKLNTNENPYPPSPAVTAAMHAVTADSLRLYPDPDSSELKKTLAAYHDVQANEIFVGNGSDEVLAFAFMSLLKHSEPLLFPDITYSFYPVYCKLFGIDYVEVPLSGTMEIDTADYDNRACGGIIFPNPNAPTGVALPLAAIEALLIKQPHAVVVVDEAYVDFGGETAIPLIHKYPNLLVIRTFSKSRSLAGLRIGFAMGHAKLIEALERVKNSFNSYPMDRLALAGAVASYGDEAYFQKTNAAIIDSREQMTAALQKLGFSVLPSTANFIFARHESYSAEQLAAGLRERAIIVRHFKHPRVNQYLRISIGNPDECKMLIQTLTLLTSKH
ncbi:histidinol-phosphate transaminase [Herminiimonas fonticola]|uniref:Histidinol-phosphate aminotransferase n=1 Tax=Herminiimonas fonticola TaxID=303380 RepID=A0A4R6G1L2_9BURK|nr:histidinol-phosphate transaminase [Herminiimonas fonticola]RBA23516.1 hisC: histidinol-phosphate transaminase [Herminiimonas fonticola]TDN88229.1 histidinol phosphate aminotransferase [Herminiimonas fonticola]